METKQNGLQKMVLKQSSCGQFLESRPDNFNLYLNHIVVCRRTIGLAARE